LADRLQQKPETGRRETEQTGAAKRRRRGGSWSSAASSARRSIEAGSAAWTGRTRAVPTRVRRLTTAAGLSVLAAICGGGSGTMRWWSTSIEDRLDAPAILNLDIGQARRTLAPSEETAWSVELRGIDGGRFVVSPAGSMEHPPWTVGGRPGVKLSSE
jgi:hypothetical protein